MPSSTLVSSTSALGTSFLPNESCRGMLTLFWNLLKLFALGFVWHDEAAFEAAADGRGDSRRLGLVLLVNLAGRLGLLVLLDGHAPEHKVLCVEHGHASGLRDRDHRLALGGGDPGRGLLRRSLLEVFLAAVGRGALLVDLLLHDALEDLRVDDVQLFADERTQVVVEDVQLFADERAQVVVDLALDLVALAHRL
eukprot:CAMPEP_0168325286 /NCGR_PEP_ID=MMETSP0213-20121227/4604_1 /TAXON_ID=151035 /ORGANISM="Euplotes harpa, Strain FSP1.4" /LENGTH=194 /DNA_ID=CAMNT_0008327755 /DNA_START=198 /DNA_END=779 /DNA_ORIENTATION=+